MGLVTHIVSETPMTDRTPLVVGNWKMNTTVAEGLRLLDAIVASPPPVTVEVAVLPPFLHLWPARKRLQGTGIELGAQDTFWEPSGAYTGEVSPVALAEICSLVLVGHSERRHLIGETDEQVARKLRAGLDAGMRVILAVGETLEERDAGRADEVVGRQLDSALDGVDAAGLERCVVAYEPVWAIGTGRTAGADDAQAMCAEIRSRCASLVDAATASRLRVLYGGSVNAENAAELFALPDVDGGLIGGASLDAMSFAAIVAAAAAAARPASSEAAG